MRCCVDFCSNTSSNVSILTGKRRSKHKGVSFHGFPREAHLRAAWLKALGKHDCHLPDSAVVCSQHFLHDDVCETESGARQLRTGAVPSTVLVCMICLDTDSRMIAVRKNDLKEAYEKLTGRPMNNRGNLKQTLCVQCAHRLRNFSRFRDKSLRARSVLRELIEKHKLITIQHIKMIDRVIYQLNSDLVSTTIGPDHWDLYVQENCDSNAHLDLAETVPYVPEDCDANAQVDLAEPLPYVHEKCDANAQVDLTETVPYVHEKCDANAQVDLVETVPNVPKDCDAIAQVDLVETVPNVPKDCNVNAQMDLAGTVPYVHEKCDANAQVDLAETVPTVPSVEAKNEHSVDSLCVPNVKDNHRLTLETKLEDSAASKRTGSDSSVRKEQKDLMQDSLMCESLVENLYSTQGSGGCSESNVQDRKPPTTTSSDQDSPHITASPTTVSPPRFRYATRNSLKTRAKVSVSTRRRKIQETNNGDQTNKRARNTKQCLICDNCQREFKRKSTLIGHLKTHTEEKLFSCGVCDFVSKYKRSLQYHMQKHTGEKYSCPVCDYRCSTQSVLKIHIRTHTGEKLFTCDVCEYICVTKTGLYKHMAIHHKKRFYCEICDYSSSNKYKLKKHVSKHTGETTCKLEYKSRCMLKVRVKKTYTCKQCEFVAGNNSDLVAHVRTHPRDKPFSCQLCEFKCAEKFDYERHMRAHSR